MGVRFDKSRREDCDSPEVRSANILLAPRKTSSLSKTVTRIRRTQKRELLLAL